MRLVFIAFTCFCSLATSYQHGYSNNSESVGKVLENEIADSCEDFFTCVQLKMLSNVSDIIRRDSFELANSVVLQKQSGATVGGGLTWKEVQKLRDPDRGGFGYLTALLVEKTLNLLRSHSLKINLLPDVDVKLFRNPSYDGKMDVALEVPNTARTFGGPRKRLLWLMLPLMYKMGVMTTMLAGLIVITLKSLTVGLILLLLAVGNLASKRKHYGGHYAPHGPTDIHVHVHNEPHSQEAYSGWHQHQHQDHAAEYPGHYRRTWPSHLHRQPTPLYTDIL
ncbi:uncharacterized protein [Periplaneta americana]|uniref:uncharacterized protein isoform X2 n=1 Tax=Periplaneta americana TaxID=6978 RepID=UPI0037E86D86